MPEVYEYTDDNTNIDENSLTVDFYFESSVTKQEAVKLIDDIMSNLSSYTKLIGHKPTVFVKSPFVTEM